ACITPSGRWLCAFRGARDKRSNAGQRTLLTWSDDAGRTWCDPFSPVAAPQFGGLPGTLRCGGVLSLGEDRLLATLAWVDDSHPDLPYFNEKTEGLLDTRIVHALSEDRGATWSAPWVMDTAPFAPPTPTTGPSLRLPSGEIMCQFELNKPYIDPVPWRHASVLMFSPDEGKTWPRYAVSAQDPEHRVFYWDQRPSLLPDGRLFVVFWTFDRASSQYLNIHARESRDGGRTWSALWDTGVPGQPGPVFALVDGSLAMPVMDRTTTPRLVLRGSTDGGVTWDTEELLVHQAEQTTRKAADASMQEAWNEMYAFALGLPHTAPLPGGGALLVYYAGKTTDETGIHWARIE
ncbi:MAG: exo-alpha-sialidase, partial [Candidatus Hydrogenedentes bacterium]|nr:exo-alpha-sialidase [Candidatus Hydrogenedentota bacterium]